MRDAQPSHPDSTQAISTAPSPGLNLPLVNESGLPDVVVITVLQSPVPITHQQSKVTELLLRLLRTNVVSFDQTNVSSDFSPLIRILGFPFR